MTRALNDFEKHSARRIATFVEMPLPLATWQTPDGKIWTPQRVLQGWTSRSSDYWAWQALHSWIMQDTVEVRHVVLPAVYNQLGDETWQFVANLGNGTFEREPQGLMGRADLAVWFEDDSPSLFVEFGTCTPAKFAFNLGTSNNDWMIVPRDSDIAFVFTPLRPPLLRNTSFDALIPPPPAGSPCQNV